MPATMACMSSLLLLALVTSPKIDTDVVYSKLPDVEMKMDIYHPAEPSEKPRAAVVVIHGGAWIGGKRQDMNPFAELLSKNGFVAATVSYRLAPKYKYPAMLDDVQTAVRYLRTNAENLNIDPKRIGACGASAGGHLSLLLGVVDTRDPKPTEYPTHSSKVQCVFNFFGPTDLTREDDYPPTLNLVFEQVLGKKRKDAAEEIKNASPYYFVTSDDAPTFIFQGKKDPLVKENQSRILEAKMKEVGVPVQAIYLDDVAHEVPIQKQPVLDAVNAGVEFMKKYLQK